MSTTLCTGKYLWYHYRLTLFNHFPRQFIITRVNWYSFLAPFVISILTVSSSLYWPLIRTLSAKIIDNHCSIIRQRKWINSLNLQGTPRVKYIKPTKVLLVDIFPPPIVLLLIPQKYYEYTLAPANLPSNE